MNRRYITNVIGRLTYRRRRCTSPSTNMITSTIPLSTIHRRWFAAPRPDPAKDYYKILEVSQNEDQKKIKTQYIKLVKKWHPDVHAKKGEAERKKAQEKFQEIYEAYEVLTDANARKEYDDLRRRGIRQKPSPHTSPGFDRHEYDRYSGFDWNTSGPSSSGSNYRRSRSQGTDTDFDREFRRRMQEEFERISRDQRQWSYNREDEYQYGNGYSRNPYPFYNPFRGLFRIFLMFFIITTMFRAIGYILFGGRYDRHGYPIHNDPWGGNGGPGGGQSQQTRYRSPWQGDTSADQRWENYPPRRPAYDPREQMLRRNREDADDKRGSFGRSQPPRVRYNPPPPLPGQPPSSGRTRYREGQTINDLDSDLVGKRKFRYNNPGGGPRYGGSEESSDQHHRRRPPPHSSSSSYSSDYSGRSSISGARIEKDVLPSSQSRYDQHPSSEARRLEYISRHADVESKAEFVRQLKAKAERERLDREQSVARRDFRARDNQRQSRLEWDEGMSVPNTESESPNEAWKRRLNSGHDLDRKSKSGWRD